MSDYIYPLAALVLDFLCLFVCIKSIFSKMGAMWIAPAFLTLAILGGSALCLFAQVYTGSPVFLSSYAVYLSWYFLGISFIWTIALILLRKSVRKIFDEYEKNYINMQEAEYISGRKAPEKYIEHMKKVSSPVSSKKIRKPVAVYDPSLSFRNYYGEAVGTKPVRKTTFRK